MFVKLPRVKRDAPRNQLSTTENRVLLDESNDSNGEEFQCQE